MKDFEPFDPDGDPTEVSAAITRDGVLILHKGIVQFLQPDEKYTDLLFSKKDQVLAVKFTKTKSKNSYTLTPVGNNVKVSMKIVLDYFFIDYSVTRVYKARFDVKERTLFVALCIPCAEAE